MCIAACDPVAADHAAEFSALTHDLNARRIGALIVLDANPAYDAPDFLRLADTFAQVPFRAHTGLHDNETAAHCTWHLPLSHALESWGDLRAPDGTASIVQPLIRTLYDTRTRDEIVALLAGQRGAKAHDLTRATWRAHADGDFETWWRRALHDGVIAGTANAPLKTRVAVAPALPPHRRRAPSRSFPAPIPAYGTAASRKTRGFRNVRALHQGGVGQRRAHHPPPTRTRLGIADEDAIEIRARRHDRSRHGRIMPGTAKGVIAATWGHGRTRAGHIGTASACAMSALGTRPFARLPRASWCANG